VRRGADLVGLASEATQQGRATPQWCRFDVMAAEDLPRFDRANRRRRPTRFSEDAVTLSVEW
jgi:hypothetical protein